MTPAERWWQMPSVMEWQCASRLTAAGDQLGGGNAAHEVPAVTHNALLNQERTKYLAEKGQSDASD